MNEKDILNLIKRIIDCCKGKNLPQPLKVRLIKLLYLIEVEYCRLYQKRLTNLEWKFYHYGPYAPELEKILGSPDLEKISVDLSKEKTGFKYELVREDEKYPIPWEVDRLISQIVSRWGDEDLNKLLDFVYFETEPMQYAKRGQLLNFSVVSKWKPPQDKTISINSRKITELQKKISERAELFQRERIKIHLKGDRDKLAKIWDEGRMDVEMKGEVIVDFNPFES